MCGKCQGKDGETVDAAACKLIPTQKKSYCKNKKMKSKCKKRYVWLTSVCFQKCRCFVCFMLCQ